MQTDDTQDLFTARRLREWRSGWTTAVSGLFLFEALTGLFIYLLPFSVSTQVTVIAHTVVGALFVAPYARYQLHHWQVNRDRPFNQHKLLGYLSLAAILVVTVSGLVLTVQAGWGTRIGYAWDLVHLVSGLAATGFVVWHVAIIVWRHAHLPDSDKRFALRAVQRHYGAATFVVAAGLLLVSAAWIGMTPPRVPTRPFPADYTLPYGDEPFVPSLATTASREAFQPGELAGSERCGTSGCHTEIVQEWQSSAHRYAAMSPFFQGVQGAMAANNGPESTRYCAGCHDPISLFSGSKTLYSDDLSAPGYQEGVSCVTCHSIEQTDVRGNANYVIAAQRRYLFEDSEAPLGAWLGDFLIRSYPEQHLQSWSRPLYKTAEYCAACHKQFIDEQINNVGWVQLQNQYDNWLQSRWVVEGDAQRTLGCRECHMRLNESLDPAAGDDGDFNRSPDDGKHRDHRFIGANQYHPALLDLPGAGEHIRLTEAWLRGDTVIPEIADRWTTGPTVPLQILAPETAAPGEQVKIRVIALNNKAGHDFPTGPLDIIQAWIEVEVVDDRDRVVYRSGTVDARGFLPSDTTVFKAEGIDSLGNLIDRHNLWEMVGSRFKRTLFPGFSDVADYAFFCPDQRRLVAPDPDPRGSRDASGGTGDPGWALPPEDMSVAATGDVTSLRVRARLRYRKVGQYFLDFLYPGQEMTAPITDMSTVEARIEIVPAAAGAAGR